MAWPDSPNVDLPPDPVIEVYKKDIDRGLLRENLKLTVEQRLIKLQKLMDAMGSSQPRDDRVGPEGRPLTSATKDDIDAGEQ